MNDIDDEIIGVVIPLHPAVQVAINDGGTVDPRLAGIPCLGIVGALGDVSDMLNLMSHSVAQAKWQKVEEVVTVVEVVEVQRDV